MRKPLIPAFTVMILVSIFMATGLMAQDIKVLADGNPVYSPIKVHIESCDDSVVEIFQSRKLIVSTPGIIEVSDASETLRINASLFWGRKMVIENQGKDQHWLVKNPSPTEGVIGYIMIGVGVVVGIVAGEAAMTSALLRSDRITTISLCVLGGSLLTTGIGIGMAVDAPARAWQVP